MFIVVCFYGVELVEEVLGTLDFADDGVRENWNQLTVPDLVTRAFRSGGLVGERLGVPPVALVLAATEPRAVALLVANLGLNA